MRAELPSGKLPTARVRRRISRLSLSMTVSGTQWGNKKYMNMKHLEAALEDASIAG